MTKQSTQAVIWCVINSFLLLTFVTPLNLLTMNVIMVPALVMMARLDTKKFILAYAISLAVVFAMTGSFGVVLLLLSLFFLTPVVVMGRLYKRMAPARTVLVSGTITLLGEFLLALILAYAAGYQPMDRLKDLLYESIDDLPTVLRNSLNQSQLDLVVHYFLQLTPLMLISASVYFVVLAHGIARWLLRKTGMTVPGLPPVRDWRLPKAMVWYFLIVTVMDFFIDIGSNSMLSMVVWNLLPLLTVAFTVQGISLLFYICYKKKWGNFLPVLAIIGMVVFFPLIYLFSLVGVLDILLPLRKRMAG